MILGIIWCCVALGGTPTAVHLTLNGQPLTLDPPPIAGPVHAPANDAQSGARATVFVSVDAFAHAVGMSAKTVAEGRLVVLCRGEKCYPIRPTRHETCQVDGRAYIAVDRLARAVGLRTTISRDGAVLTVALSDRPDAQAGVTAVGSPLPDVVLRDLDGRKVHLAQFVGKRLLICTWASW